MRYSINVRTRLPALLLSLLAALTASTAHAYSSRRSLALTSGLSQE